MDAHHFHDLQDDQESFFWVLSWVALRFVSHVMGPQGLAGLLGGLDERFVGEVGQGGLQKRDLLTGVRFLELEFTNCLNLQSLIATLVDMLQLRYRAPGPHNPLDILPLFRTALSNRDEWPAADAAIPQRVGSGHTENKRKCDDKKLQGRLPKQPKVFNFNELDFQVGSCEEGPSDEDDG
jgi:hypothetical protein